MWRGNLSYFDCVKTPMTSAYKSAMMCTLPVLGPQYLQVQKGKEFVKYKKIGGQTTRKHIFLMHQPSMYVIQHRAHSPLSMFKVLKSQV